MQEFMRFLGFPFLLFDTWCVQFTLLALKKVFSSSVTFFVSLFFDCSLFLLLSAILIAVSFFFHCCLLSRCLFHFSFLNFSTSQYWCCSSSFKNCCCHTSLQETWPWPLWYGQLQTNLKSYASFRATWKVVAAQLQSYLSSHNLYECFLRPLWMLSEESTS